MGSSFEILLLSNSPLLIWRRVSTQSSAEKANQNPEGENKINKISNQFTPYSLKIKPECTTSRK